jgi:hypothetical protein
MSLSISITYAPLAPKRRGNTVAIMSALRTMQATPKDGEGNPASFLIVKKHRGAVRVAAEETGIKVRTRVEGDNLRVFLEDVPNEDATLPLPGV